MTTANTTAHPKLDNILIATDFSPASERATRYAIAIARRHQAKLFVVHIVGSQSETALMDGWRAAQTEIMKHFMAGRLKDVEYVLLVRSGDIWNVVSGLIAEHGIDLVVVGTRGRTGVWKLILGSVAETIFRQATCPVLTVGPNITSKDPEAGPLRILVPTGFARHSLYAVQHALWLAQELHSSIALLNVVTDPQVAAQDKDRLTRERLERLQALIPSPNRLPSPPAFFVEFGSAPERIIETANDWSPDLLVLGLHAAGESPRRDVWAKAYEIVCNSPCPVMTIHAPQE